MQHECCLQTVGAWLSLFPPHHHHRRCVFPGPAHGGSLSLTRGFPGAQGPRVPPPSGAGCWAAPSAHHRPLRAPSEPTAGSEEPLTAALSLAPAPLGPQGRCWRHLEDFSLLPAAPNFSGGTRGCTRGSWRSGVPPSRPSSRQGGSWRSGCGGACRAVAQVALGRL